MKQTIQNRSKHPESLSRRVTAMATDDFGRRVRIARTERRLSRRQLAEAIGVSPQTIGAIERGSSQGLPATRQKLRDFLELVDERTVDLRPLQNFVRSGALGLQRDFLAFDRLRGYRPCAHPSCKRWSRPPHVVCHEHWLMLPERLRLAWRSGRDRHEIHKQVVGYLKARANLAAAARKFE